MLGFNFDPVTIVILLVALSLAPFVIMMISSFVKIVIVLSLIRNALGVQQSPPNIVLNGIALILTIYIMAPVGMKTLDLAIENPITINNLTQISQSWGKIKEPIQDFLYKHSKEKERAFFIKTAKRLWPKERADALTPKDMIVLVPSFTISELTSAFEIGFLIYLPFIAIDLIVSNILLAMGMMMVSPMTISLPFKLMLFVLVDGWSRLIEGIVLSYK
ncbi:MAG: EscR/YscR/HrcR family type III secretion system export apparatus protein [Verrucomicrobia bacterium GWC2_42_7]|nr:MAG: EscR/YscR/HrcR family type III secretion system export apparatus protein [Verrucomicrobia bacterium GWC2_42_7]